jgi:hypothetical protein
LTGKFLNPANLLSSAMCLLGFSHPQKSEEASHMQPAYVAAAAAVVIASTGFAVPANAVCNPRNPTACSSLSDLKREAPAQAGAHQAVDPTKRQTSEAPLQLHPKKSRRAASRSTHRHAHGPSRHRVAAKPAPEDTATAAAPPPDATTSQPKAVPTVAVAAPPVAVTPRVQADGFAASHEPWSNVSAFASPETPTSWPPTTPRVWQPKARDGASSPDVKVVASDAVNEIDLAADTSVQANAGGADRGVSLVSQAKAAEGAQPNAEERPEKESWTAWLYRICAGTLYAAASAVRAVLM